MKREELVSAGDYAKKTANDLGLRDFYPGIGDFRNGAKRLFGLFDGADFSVDIVVGESDEYEDSDDLSVLFIPPGGFAGIENFFSFPVNGADDPKIDEILSVLLPGVTEEEARRFFRTFEGFIEFDDRD